MFQLIDTFKAYDANKQPYSFTVERHTETENLRAGVQVKAPRSDGGMTNEAEGFALKALGNRHILNTPVFETATFATEFKITFLQVIQPEFILYFRYDEKKRKGQGIRIHHDLNETLTVQLVVSEGTYVKKIAEQTVDSFRLEEEWVPLTLQVEKDRVVCEIRDQKVAFSCEKGSGKIALERSAFIGELYFKQIQFCSEDPFETISVLPKTTVKIPMTNGGDIPYIFTWQLDQIEGEYYFRCELEGGTKTRKVDREGRKGQYWAELDWIEDPYVGICCQGQDHIFHLSVGTNGFVDPNIVWDCLKPYFADTDLPLASCYKVCPVTIDEEVRIIYGYRDMHCTGYMSQRGGNEFRYTRNGELVYNGAPLDGSDIGNVYSPFDKYAVRIIPLDCVRREEVVEHFKYNHYFEVSEKVKFSLEFATQGEIRYFTARAKIHDIFETEVLAETDTNFYVADEREPYFPKVNRYCRIWADAEFDPLPVGVYKIEFEIMYGEQIYRSVKHVFEVFNHATEEIPPVVSGLPYLFSMPNACKWLERNSFDGWSPARSCDIEHYISCVTDTPVEAENRRSWEIFRLFKREWFVWVGPRTANDYLSKKHEIVMEHADYLFYALDNGIDDWGDSCSIFPFRPDHWQYPRVNNPFQKKLLIEFFEMYPEAEKILQYKPEGGNMPLDVFEKFMNTYRKPWMHLVNERTIGLFEQQNQELKEINPKIRRAAYGPVSIYNAPTVSVKSMNIFGMPSDQRLRDTVFTGFAIFEDYPYSCAYHTYRGAFFVMTVLTHVPDFVMYPEQYAASLGGCIDGAVKYNNAPMGKYALENYQNTTQCMEYVYNTAHLLKDGFHYWETYGFHREDFTSETMNEMNRDWRHVVKNKPAKPLRSLAFLTDFADADDVFRGYQLKEEERKFRMYNMSEIGTGFIHECSRKAGVPNGFALRATELEKLTADQCDVLVIPSTEELSKEALNEIRRLYKEGVNLIGVSKVSGLEDLFEVQEHAQRVFVTEVSYGEQVEYVSNLETTFRYEENGAKAVLNVNGEVPAVLTTERTALINTDISALGEDIAAKGNVSNTSFMVGKLIRQVMEQEIARLSRPLVKGENVAVTLYETREGRCEVMAIYYAPFDNERREGEEAVIQLNMDNVTMVKSEKQIFVGKEDGMVKELRFRIRPHETVFIQLDSTKEA